MDWKTCAVEDLRRYRHMKIGVINSRDRLCALNTSAKRAIASAESSGLHTDTRIIDTIVESERLRDNMEVAESIIKLIERGLDALSDEERNVLEKFYINDAPINITRLKSELGYESRSIYRLRDRALKKFTLAMYGVEFL